VSLRVSSGCQGSGLPRSRAGRPRQSPGSACRHAGRASSGVRRVQPAGRRGAVGGLARRARGRGGCAGGVVGRAARLAGCAGGTVGRAGGAEGPGRGAGRPRSWVRQGRLGRRRVAPGVERAAQELFSRTEDHS
jgi:hypothetical protein